MDTTHDRLHLTALREIGRRLIECDVPYRELDNDSAVACLRYIAESSYSIEEVRRRIKDDLNCDKDPHIYELTSASKSAESRRNAETMNSLMMMNGVFIQIIIDSPTGTGVIFL